MCDCFVQDKAAKTQHSSATQGFFNAVLGKRINNNGHVSAVLKDS